MLYSVYWSSCWEPLRFLRFNLSSGFKYNNKCCNLYCSKGILYPADSHNILFLILVHFSHKIAIIKINFLQRIYNFLVKNLIMPHKCDSCLHSVTKLFTIKCLNPSIGIKNASVNMHMYVPQPYLVYYSKFYFSVVLQLIKTLSAKCLICLSLGLGREIRFPYTIQRKK